MSSSLTPSNLRLAFALCGCWMGIASAEAQNPKPAFQKATTTSNRAFSDVAKALIAAINLDDQDAMQQLFTPALRQALPSEKAGPFFAQVVAMRGKILQIGAPQMDEGTADVRLRAERGAWNLQITLGAQNRISSLLIQAAGPTFALPAPSAKPLALPFRGEWMVFWGGATRKQNYHVASPAQRRAIDAVMVDAKGRSHRAGGQRNADYYAYGQPILATGAGTVVRVADGVADNTPGEMNPAQVTGNSVVVQQGRTEFAFFAHLQPGSIRVKVGDKIRAAQVLGLCGNSGNSSEPHLHFHLQNTPELSDGTGIAPLFENVRVVRNGRATVSKSYAPQRGDRVGAVTGMAR